MSMRWRAKWVLGATTARRALVELADEGLLKRVRGKGTFVRPSFSPRPRTRRTGVGVVSAFNYNDPGSIFYHRILHAVQVASEAAGISPDVPAGGRTVRVLHSRTGR